MTAPERTRVCVLLADEVRALTLIAAKDDVRYYLQGVNFDPAQQVAVATDGHLLLLKRVEFEAQVPSFILPRAALEKAVRLTSRLAHEIVISVVPGGSPRRQSFVLKGNKGELVCTEIDARFPNYRDVVPTAVSLEAAHYDPRLTFRMQQAFGLMQHTGEEVIYRPLPNGGKEAGLVVCADPTVLGVIMPMRDTRVNDLHLAAALLEFGLSNPV